MTKKISVIGAAVVDIIAGPVDKDLFKKGSVPYNSMAISCGGDALNEAVMLSKLGMPCELVTLIGDDEGSKKIRDCLRDNNVSMDKISIMPEIATGMNIVLVDDEGERYFITNPESSLRKLSKEHILPHVDKLGDIVSFASIFVSPCLSIEALAEVFEAIKEKPDRILVSDMTTAKKGERIEDLDPVLKYIDYVIPNEKEAALLTGESDPVKSARAFVKHGAGCAIIKCGSRGCIYDDGTVSGSIPAYHAKAIDTTGAGDSFVSGFIYGLYNGMNIPECCIYGSAVASVVIEHWGTNICVSIDEVNRRAKTF